MAAPGMGQGETILDRAWAVLDGCDDEQLWRLDPKLTLNQVAIAQKLINRLHGLQLRLVAEAESTGLGNVELGWSTANVLVDQQPQALRTARATVLLATELVEYEQVGAALRAGDISVEQAQAVVHGLKEIPDTCSAEQVAQAERELVEHARRFDPGGVAADRESAGRGDLSRRGGRSPRTCAGA